MSKNKKIVVLGSGYIGSAYAKSGIDCIDSSQFRYIGQLDKGKSNFSDLINLVDSYDVIINCIGWTDTKSSELPKNFKELWFINAHFVHELSEYCKCNNKKLVHISTGDLYGNVSDITNHEDGDVMLSAYDQTIELNQKLDVETSYRFTKLGGDKFCNPQDLILRVRLPFDGREHPKNLICKTRNFTNFYQFQNTFTYLPDLINSTDILIEQNQFGIFNIVQYEPASILYLMRNILGLPELQKINIHNNNDPHIISKLNAVNIHNDVNSEKLRKFFIQTPLEAAWTISWEQLKIVDIV